MTEQTVRIAVIYKGEIIGADLLISAEDFMDLSEEELHRRYILPAIHLVKDQLNERRDSIPGESR